MQLWSHVHRFHKTQQHLGPWPDAKHTESSKTFPLTFLDFVFQSAPKWSASDTAASFINVWFGDFIIMFSSFCGPADSQAKWPGRLLRPFPLVLERCIRREWLLFGWRPWMKQDKASCSHPLWLAQRWGESTQHYFIKVLACSLIALVIVTGTKEALIPSPFSHLRPFICRSAQRSIHTGRRDKRGPWCWASEITATRHAPRANAEPQKDIVFLSIPWYMQPTTMQRRYRCRPAPGSAKTWWTPALRCG